MADFELILGNKNYSSWSLRGWLAMRRTGAPFRETIVPLGEPASAAEKARHSPSGKVPVLRHGELVVHESLAIGEYLAELFPEAGLWPADRGARAVARAISHEMHAGFQALRDACPMNIRAERTGPLSQSVEQDVRRVIEIWTGCRRQFGAAGPFLFGGFTLADVMFAPVVTRFRTYGIDHGDDARAYADAVWTAPEMVEWREAAAAEPWTIPAYDG